MNKRLKIYKHVPCLLHTHETSLYHANNYAYCQAGTSVLMSSGPSLGDRYDAREDTFLSYGMPSALNFRGLVGVRNLKGNEFVYGNGSKLCRFNPITDEAGYRGQGYCANLWDKYSYLGMAHAYVSRYVMDTHLFEHRSYCDAHTDMCTQNTQAFGFEY